MTSQVSIQLIKDYTTANVMIIILLMFLSCNQESSSGNNPPVLEYVSMDKNVMISGNGPEDQIIVTLNFEDVDGDIAGISDDNIPSNIFIQQVREGGDIENVSFPEFPDLTEGQKGIMDLTILTTCCLGPRGCVTEIIDSVNIFPYDIYIVDGMGNESNVIRTPLVTLICN